ncbi:MAG: META domain-containing protein [Pseudomonadales bacterium]|jgi:heat shock protein HslJ|nr:META domain-containing protein [Pseudomonadales bacterium]
MRTFKSLAARALTILLSACAQHEPVPEEATITQAVTFLCGRQPVSFLPQGAGATLVVGEKRVELLQARAASGARYLGESSVEFWSRGDEALLTLAGEVQPTCIRSDRLTGAWTTQLEARTAQLRFMENGAFAATVGCNRLRGAYELRPQGRIGFGVPASTKMACGELMEAEQRLWALFSERQYTLRFDGEARALLVSVDGSIELLRADAPPDALRETRSGPSTQPPTGTSK